jgi:hypothetical protein
MTCSAIRSAVLGMLLLAACVTAAAPAGAAISVSFPGILDKRGATYVLARDVTAPGTAFTIAADQVTLDLAGHTITYGTAPGDDRHGVISEEHDGVVIKNGAITQGPGNGAGCHAVSVVGSDVEIADLTITVQGADTDAIFTNWGRRIHIHGNRCTNNCAKVTNRHQGVAAIDVINNAGGGTAVHDNIVENSPQFGIRVRAKPAGSSGFAVYDNQVSHQAIVTNPYAIAVDNMGDCEVYGTRITARNGRGIHVESETMSPGWVLVHDNQVDVKEGPNPEYAVNWTHGIKLEGAPHARVYNNQVIARAEPGFGHAYALDLSLTPGTDCEIYHNTFTAISTDPAFIAAACHPLETERGCGARLHDNVFESNSRLLYWNWGGGDSLYLASNVFRRLPGEVPFHTLHFENGGSSATDITLLDSRLEGGASLDDVFMKPNAVDVAYTVRWYLTVAVRDADGQPVAGARVTITDRAGAQVFAEATTEQGTMRADLVEYAATGPPAARTEHTPHRVRVSKAGFQAREVTATVDHSQELAVTLERAGN